MQRAGSSPHKNHMKRPNREIYNTADSCRDLDDANFAYMNRDKIPVLCSRKKAWEWYHNGGAKRCNIRLDEGEDLAGWGINTRFHFWGNESDGPPLFWEVSVWFSDGNPNHFRSGTARFGTMKEALFFHERLLENIQEFGEVLEDQRPTLPDGTVLLIPVIKLKGLFEDDDNREEDDEHDPSDWWKE
jgi:hypothetical protein